MIINSISQVNLKNPVNCNSTKENLNFQARLLKPTAFLSTASALALLGISTNKAEIVQPSKKEQLVQSLKNNPERVKAKLMLKDKDGCTPMHGRLSKEDIMIVNEAFVEAGEIDKLAEIHLNNTDAGIPIEKYRGDSELILSTLNALKTKPDAINKIAESGALSWCKYHKSNTTANLCKLKELFKDSPELLSKVLVACGFEVDKDTYKDYFKILQDMPNVLVKLPRNTIGEDYEEFGIRYFRSYDSEISRDMTNKYLDLAINSDLSAVDSLHLLSQIGTGAQYEGIISEEEYGAYINKLNRLIDKEEEAERNRLFNEMID